MRMRIRARSQQDKRERRQRLLSAAMELFVERGYESPTVEMITKRAGVSVGAFYLYFRGKHEIYKVFQNEGIDVLFGMLGPVFSGDYPSARERLVQLAGAYLRFFRQYRHYYGFIALISIGGQGELRETETEIGRTIDEKTVVLLRQIEAAVASGIRSGEFYPVDAWKTACVLWGMMDGFILMHERDNVRVAGVTLDELVMGGLETVFSGIARRSHTSDARETGGGVTVRRPSR
jgi:AcrR family transcriptional regulator